MLSNQEHVSLEDASRDLLAFALDPRNWVSSQANPGAEPSATADYQRKVGKLRVSASVAVQPNLRTELRVAFRAPGLTPVKAADHLEVFLKSRLPLMPNTEWQVEMDGRSWIHFVRPYTVERLTA